MLKRYNKRIRHVIERLTVHSRQTGGPATDPALWALVANLHDQAGNGWLAYNLRAAARGARREYRLRHRPTGLWIGGPEARQDEARRKVHPSRAVKGVVPVDYWLFTFHNPGTQAEIAAALAAAGVTSDTSRRVPPYLVPLADVDLVTYEVRAAEVDAGPFKRRPFVGV